MYLKSHQEQNCSRLEISEREIFVKVLRVAKKTKKVMCKKRTDDVTEMNLRYDEGEVVVWT